MENQAGIETVIRATFAEVYLEMNGGEMSPDLDRESVLLETGLDSLGFAVLVARLEETLLFDPFSASDEPFYPTTFGEFVDYYVDNQP